jgi:hypothetical protein
MKKLSKSKNKSEFVLLQDVGEYKKGKVFDSFGGLVSGVVAVLSNNEEKKLLFYDSEWFKLKK